MAKVDQKGRCETNILSVCRSTPWGHVHIPLTVECALGFIVMEAYVIIQYQLCVTLKGQVSARRRLPEFGVRQNATSRQAADLFAPRLPSMVGGERILGAEGRFRQDSLCACSAVACRVIRPSIIEGPWPHGTPCIGPNTIQERADGAVLQRVSLRRTCCSRMCYVEHSGEDSHCQWLDMRAQPSAADLHETTSQNNDATEGVHVRAGCQDLRPDARHYMAASCWG